jgi:hypothetical protein
VRTVNTVNYPKLYDPAAMASVKVAFYDVWEALQAQNAVRIGPDQGDLKAAIIRRLIHLVAVDGTTDPKQLKAKVLQNLPLA